MRRLTRLLGVALLGACTLVVVGPAGPAFANASCSGSAINAWDGYQGFSTPPGTWARTPEGVSSYLTAVNGTTCSNYSYPATFSAAWVMLQDNGVGSHYFQAGYISTGSCMKYFTEWNVGSGANRVLGACVPLAEKDAYRVLYRGLAGPYPPTTGAMELTAPGLDTIVSEDPWQLGWSFQPDYLGEVTDFANDIPGSAANPGTYSDMGIQSVQTGGLIPVPCYLRILTSTKPGVTNRYFASSDGCTTTYIWTNPL